MDEIGPLGEVWKWKGGCNKNSDNHYIKIKEKKLCGAKKSYICTYTGDSNYAVNAFTCLYMVYFLATVNT
jgi:hypothetical protein